MLISEQVRKAAQSSPLNQRALADKARIHESAVSRFCNGKPIALDRFDRLAKALGFTLTRKRTK